MKGAVHSLETQIQKLLKGTIKSPAEALISCSRLEHFYRQSKESHTDISEKPPADARALLSQVLERTKPTAEDLRSFFTAQPHPSTESSIMVLDSYNKTSGILPRNVAMIPFREATYNCKFDKAFDILDRTVGTKSNLEAAANKKIRKLALGWSTGMCGILVGVDQLLSSGIVGDWTANKPMVLAMVFAYCGAVSTYSVLAFAGRNSNERMVSWVPGTPLSYRYKYKTKLDMASTLAQMNMALPENQGECGPKMIDQLKARHMNPVESTEEAELKEYWARGGEGFDWAEPDQDPADIIWRTKMDAAAQKRIGSPYVRTDNGKIQTWADSMLNIQENRTLPHASLIDIEALRGPEKMAELEKELEKLRSDLNNPSLPESIDEPESQDPKIDEKSPKA